MFAMPVILYSLFVSKNVKKTFSDFGFKKISFTIVLCSIGLGFVLFFINNYVADIFYTILSLVGYDNSINVTLSTNTTILSEFFLTAMIPGFCEEVLHRGMFMRGSSKQGYTRYGLLLSSILFGLMHLNIQQFFYAMILGGLMGFVVLIADSIYPAMIIHFMNNALSIYFSYGHSKGWPFTEFKAQVENAIFSLNLYTVVAIIGLIILALFGLYKALLHAILRDKNKQMATQLAKDLKMDNMSYEEMQSKLDEVGKVLESKTDKPFEINNSQPKLKFVDNIFLNSSLILGALITISSFIWGVM